MKWIIVQAVLSIPSGGVEDTLSLYQATDVNHAIRRAREDLGEYVKQLGARNVTEAYFVAHEVSDEAASSMVLCGNRRHVDCSYDDFVEQYAPLDGAEGEETRAGVTSLIEPHDRPGRPDQEPWQNIACRVIAKYSHASEQVYFEDLYVALALDTSELDPDTEANELGNRMDAAVDAMVWEYLEPKLGKGDEVDVKQYRYFDIGGELSDACEIYAERHPDIKDVREYVDMLSSHSDFVGKFMKLEV